MSENKVMAEIIVISEYSDVSVFRCYRLVMAENKVMAEIIVISEYSDVRAYSGVID